MRLWLATASMAALIAGPIGIQPAGAQPAGKPRTERVETCTAKAPPPFGFTSWDQPADLTGALTEAGLAQATFVPGKAIIAKLAPVDRVTYRKPVQKADGPPVYGALYRLKITQAGTYRVQASAGPWIDLFKDDATPLRSIAHGHGPACTGLAKYVDFPLQPGDYLVQFSESLTPQQEIMVARVGA